MPPKVKHRDEIENMLPVLERATFTAKLLSTENYDFCLSAEIKMAVQGYLPVTSVSTTFWTGNIDGERRSYSGLTCTGEDTAKGHGFSSSRKINEESRFLPQKVPQCRILTLCNKTSICVMQRCVSVSLCCCVLFTLYSNVVHYTRCILYKVYIIQSVYFTKCI